LPRGKESLFPFFILSLLARIFGRGWPEYGRQTGQMRATNMLQVQTCLTAGRVQSLPAIGGLQVKSLSDISHL